jgi:hypothetical protein
VRHCLLSSITISTCSHVSGSSCCRASHAVLNQTLCSVVNGTWVPASCTPTTEPACDTAGGGWSPRRMGSLEGGVDLLVVALLQVSEGREASDGVTGWWSRGEGSRLVVHTGEQ